MQKVNFASTFLRLTILGYILAVASVGLAVWIATQPILLKMQHEAKRSHLNTKAEVITRLLDDFIDEGRYSTEMDSVRRLLNGEGAQEEQVRDELSRFYEAQNIRLVDVSGRELLSPPIAQAPSRYLEVEALIGLSEMVEGRSQANPIVSYRPGDGLHNAIFLINVPVTLSGQVKGILSFEVNSDLTEILALEGDAANTLLLTRFQLSQWSTWNSDSPDPVIVPMPGTNFFLAADPNSAFTAKSGLELIRVAISVAFLALLIPFLVLGFSGFQAIVKPQRQLEKSRSELFEKTERLAELAQVAEMASESIILTDSNGQTTWVNRAFTQSTGYFASEVVGKKPGSFLQGPETDQEAVISIAKALSNRESVQREVLNYTKSGEPYWINLSISPIPNPSGGTARFASISTNITEIKQAQAALELEKEKTEFQALHDPLTGLPNRRAIDHALEHIVEKATTARTLVRIDLDHFKNVNDTLGHAAGDFVLCRVADILLAEVRKDDLPARAGGDEFVVLLAEGTSVGDAEAFTERLRLKIRQEMKFEGKSCRVGASFGISSSQTGLVQNGELLKSADSALYAAKDAGRNQTVLYTAEVHHEVLARRRISSEIENAIHRSEFLAYFQPQFDAQTEALIGIEALARWDHPSRGVLAPAAFLDIAEKLKLVSDIDQQVFTYGLDCVAELNTEGLDVPKIAFNVSAKQLLNPTLARVAKEKKIATNRIALEILESVLIEDESQDFLDHVVAFKTAGFQIEVDDFGSGHASVISLKRLRPDVMKIDRELVMPVVESKTARSLVKSIIGMGHALGIKVLAEGVETAQHAAIMRDLGCDSLQGFFFARPMPFNELREFAKVELDSKISKVTSLSTHSASIER